MNKAENLFNKIAYNSTETMVGAGSTVGGAALMSSAYRRGDLTGRETMWHSTPAKNSKNIKDKGILKTKANEGGTLTRRVVNDVDPKKLDNKVYMARKKNIASGVGNHYRIAGDRVDVLKARVPTWKLKEVDNPELGGAKTTKAFKRVMKDRSPLFKTLDEVPVVGKPLSSLLARRGFKGLGRKGTGTFENDIKPEWIKQSPKYKRETLSEIGEFISKNPKRFAKGVAKGLGGAALVGAGAKLIHKNFKEPEKNMSKKAEQVFEKMAKKGPIKHFWETLTGEKARKANKLLDNQRGKNVSRSARRVGNEYPTPDEYKSKGTLGQLVNEAINRIQGKSRETKRLQTRLPKLERLADRAEKAQYIAQGSVGAGAALTGAELLTD